MTHRYTIGGVAFTVDDALHGMATDGFADVAIHAEFVEADLLTSLKGPDIRKVAGPGNLKGLVNPAAGRCWLPAISNESSERAWQLRQMAPIFAAAAQRLVLHASAALVGDAVVALVGESGAGKSTLVRFLDAHGHPLVADDLLPVRFRPEPRSPVGDTLVALGGVLFIDRASHNDVSLDRCSPTESMERLIQHGFGEHDDPEAWRFQFDAYHRIAESTQAFDLSIPDDLASLPTVEHMLMTRFRGPTGAPRNNGET